ncbi:hypothetical protein FMM05_15825 [Flavobacterium zepuense]|uniref:Peptidase MA-like domain-containing protein n=1 Tax=Flavobacterium zepuense TaxID=2593302 RepID=A0A552UWZ9_9FLAO|nr:peptidase MA family metallohydrolase [Flavobacterium zepuense]TRW22725.1 hypothetical protein FMM05_15825 [Flavobacterium zepuense]
MKKTTLLVFTSLLFCLNLYAQGWSQNIRNVTTIDNITYYFPESISLTEREAYIKLCRDSVKENLELIREKDFEYKMDIEFLSSRDEMLKLTGMAAQGMAMYPLPKFYSVLKLKNSPVKHEMMHMIAMQKWGHNAEPWLNEGLATYAGGTCSPYSLEQIYRYYMQSGKLIPAADLANNFWSGGYNDMITYTQSAYLVSYLMETYGMEKFKHLWIGGYAKFREIYGFDFKVVEDSIATRLKKKYPEGVAFDWDTFNKGCE